MADIRTCDSCNKPFPALKEWATKCLLCWGRDTKGDRFRMTTTMQAYESLQDALANAGGTDQTTLETIRRLQCEKDWLVGRLSRANARIGFLEVECTKGASTGVDPKAIKALLRMVHPDRARGLASMSEVELTAHLGEASKILNGMR